MSSGAEASAPGRSFAAWATPWRTTLVFVTITTIVRLVFLATQPFALIEDEAHYWDWSRHLGLSYYSKGPGIAWLISAGTAVAGPTELGVRLGAVLAAAVASLAIAALARDAFADGRCGFFAAAVFQLVPVFQGVSVLMTIDGPYLACWALASWAAWRALARGSGPAWIALGAAVGAGFLFKYTIVLLLPGIAIAAVWGRPLVLTRRWPAWGLAGAMLALGGLAPVAVWNALHDWATVRHLLGHAGIAGGDAAPSDDTGFNPLWALEFVGVQLGLIGPALVLMSASVRRGLGDAGARTGARFTLALPLPLLAFYLLLSWFTRAEGNWPIAGYVTLCAASGWGVVSGMEGVRARRAAWRRIPPNQRPRSGALRKAPELARQVSWHWSLGWGFTAAIGLMSAASLARLPGFGAWIPIERLRGAPTLAASVEAQRQSLVERTGLEPFVIAQHYGRTAQLAFYLADRPTVYCSSSLQHGRRTQYDEWAHTDLRRSDVTAQLAGRPAVLLGADAAAWQIAFDTVEPLGALPGEHKRDRLAFLGLGFRGWPTEGQADAPRPTEAGP